MSYNTGEAEGKIFNLKGEWDNRVPQFRQKVNNMYGNGNVNNPFLNKSGGLINPYINYQAALDNPNVTQKAKEFITQATGLTPSKVTPEATPSTEMQQDAKITADLPEKPAGNVKTADSSIVNAAQGYLGTPYVWGGESMSEGGMDCSGFVYNALKDAGYKVGRTTAQGYRSYGSSVSKADMQPGDLVFFGKNGKASHIGIYIGNGQMIHSSGGSKNTKSNPGKGVSVTGVDYRNDFIEARRV